jgi:hypothetical protein
VPIEIHCNRCNSAIRAPDGSGGKRGKCPHCGHELYIPVPSDEVEEIPVAPLDNDEEERAAALRRESIEYAAMLDKAVASPPQAGGKGSAGRARQAQPGGKSVDVAAEVQKFVMAMGDSQFDHAEDILKRLRGVGKKANDYIQQLLCDQMPPKIGKVPPEVAKNFLKALSDRLAG